MDSSVIFLAVIGLWAAYLVPHWLKRREDLSASRSVDRFSAAMRVLAHRPDTSQRPRRQERSYVLMPPREDVREVEVKRSRPVDRQLVAPVRVPVPLAAPARAQVPRPAQPPAAATTAWAARLLAAWLVLGLLSLPVLGALSVAGLTPLWTPAAAVGSVAAALVGLRIRAVRRAAAAPARTAAPAVHVDAASDVEEVSARPRGDELYDESVHAAAEDAQRLRTLAEHLARAADVPPYREPDPGEWTPVAVPLPSYLLQPDAPPRWTAPVPQLTQVARREVDEDDIPTYAPSQLRAAGQ